MKDTTAAIRYMVPEEFPEETGYRNPSHPHPAFR